MRMFLIRIVYSCATHKHRIACFIIVFFFMAACNYIQAQYPVFRQYEADNGLASNQVYKVFQDAKSYLWFSTDAGVCRYDGTTFKRYTTKEGLCDNTGCDWLEDSKH